MKVKKATLEDVGRLAGVSRQTVSRVVNNHPLVSDDARRRVVDAMASLNYRLNSVARSLATSRTFLIGILTTSFARYIPALILEGVEQELRRVGFQLFVTRCDTGSAEEPLAAPLAKTQALEGALVLHNGLRGQPLTLLDDLPTEVPIVTTGYAASHGRVNSITIANGVGAEKAAKYLVSRGRRRFAMITGPELNLDAIERSTGFFSGLETLGFNHGDCEVRVGDWSYERGYSAMRDILTTTYGIDAVFAQNDPSAVGAIRAIHDLGRKVPDDIAVIGFDNIPIAKYVEPSLTTLRNPAFELGKIAARLLTTLIVEDGAVDFASLITVEDRRLLEPELIIRESC